MFRRLSLFLIVLLLVGCAVINPVSLPSDLEGKPLDKHGVVFGSIGADSENGFFQDQAIYYRKVGSEQRGAFRYLRTEFSKMPEDFSSTNVSGSAFSFNLPPGEYEVFNLRLWKNFGYFDKTTTSKEDFSVKFTVEEGKAIYLGEFISRHFSAQFSGSGYFIVSTNKMERDKSLLSGKGVTFPENIENISPLFIDLKHPMLRDKMIPYSSRPGAL
ncbi:MAG: hypothetical protein PHI11_04085 [Gallionella sp.]|nr:hypothetical protein [Gallionella sp.]